MTTEELADTWSLDQLIQTLAQEAMPCVLLVGSHWAKRSPILLARK